jgi:hypothetical protein
MLLKMGILFTKWGEEHSQNLLCKINKNPQGEGGITPSLI